jgi:cephalosporin hydroxylase
MGTPVIKYPSDLFLYQEIIFENKPDFIVETGTERGGSSLFFAGICDLIGKGRIITIDVEDRNPPKHSRITHLIGRSTSAEILSKVKEMVGNGTVMVSLDSDHHRRHVKREMFYYGPMVTKGQYMVVEDTNYPIIRKRGSYEGGPDEAVSWYMKTHKDFKDMSLEKKWIFSCNPKGWLLKVS